MPKNKKKKSDPSKLLAIFFAALAVLALSYTIFFKVYRRATAPASVPVNLGALSIEQKMQLSNAQWKQILTPLQYLVLREAGTETPFTGDLLHNTQKGTYVTADCGEPVFSSDQKFDSGTGWPSFWAPISPDAVTLREDDSLGMQRTEVLSKKCGSHLGHVFDDGPPPTGKRYCINSAALKFIPATASN